MSKDAAIYLRVGTDEQTIDNQRPDLERVAEARGLVIVATYEERASAAKRRPSFDRMMTDARRGTFNVLLVWSIDRFGRSMTGNVNDALALHDAGVRMASVRVCPQLHAGTVRACERLLHVRCKPHGKRTLPPQHPSP
jgi:DNA invertase Pin-like site-specific DNA recombinase